MKFKKICWCPLCDKEYTYIVEDIKYDAYCPECWHHLAAQIEEIQDKEQQFIIGDKK